MSGKTGYGFNKGETPEETAAKVKKNLLDYSKWKDIQDEEEDEEVKEEKNEKEEEQWQKFLDSANTWTKDEKDEYVGKIGVPALFANPEEFKVRLQHALLCCK
jgi:hypothetical protein